jgi:hypothetical protein
MHTPFGHLTYCSNIHIGEAWPQHFAELKANIPLIKQQTCPDRAMGIGLRLANEASITLTENANLEEFKTWLNKNDCYVFTMNGFPYGGFHNVVVKDQVHAPDWTTEDRLAYTIRLFELLAKLLPANLQEGGISTSPLSYRFWWKDAESLNNATHQSTENILLLVDKLITIGKETGKIMHLDVEPEPGGLLENGTEFIDWYQNVLIPKAITHFEAKGISAEKAIKYIHRHVQLCYDICHFGVSFENPSQIIDHLNHLEIRVGKIQISSALKVDFTANASEKIAELAHYNEPTYLHQVIAKCLDGTFEKFSDLDQAMTNYTEGKYSEWRIHFHVPLFIEHYGLLSSTQSEIVKTLSIQKRDAFTNHLEIETYTWGVLPADVALPLNESIIREIDWVAEHLNN